MEPKKFTNSFSNILFVCAATSGTSWALGTFVSPIIPAALIFVVGVIIAFAITPHLMKKKDEPAKVFAATAIFLSVVITSLQFNSSAGELGTNIVSAFIILVIIIYSAFAAGYSSKGGVHES